MWLMGLLAVVGMSVTMGCSEEEHWHDTLPFMEGVWETQLTEESDNDGYVQYKAQFVSPTDIHACWPYGVVGIRKDGTQVLLERGIVGEPNDSKGDELDFYDQYNWSAYSTTIVFLNKQKTEMRYHSKVWYKTK